MMSSCNEHEYEPLEHLLSSWLSTDYPDDFVFPMTDPSRFILFRSAALSDLSVETIDGFVVEQSRYSWQRVYDGDCFECGIVVTPLHVGNTYFRISDSEHDTLIKVQVLPQYYTYTEPSLDFDDTEDSVKSKLSKLFYQYDYDFENHCYQVSDVRCSYNLNVNYSNRGTIDSYVVDLCQGVDPVELSMYLNERYYYLYSQDLPIYIRAFNETNPSIYDATMVVIPDAMAHRVIYQNPVTYGKL